MTVLPSDLLRQKTVTLLIGPDNALRAALAGALREQPGSTDLGFVIDGEGRHALLQRLLRAYTTISGFLSGIWA